MEYKLVAIKVEQRESSATRVQEILTSFGCNIKVRLGLHDVPANTCSPSGLIILEVVAEDREIEKFLSDLNVIPKVTAKKLVI
jgi:hypothetical protein